ncbi:MAG: hypothetical protein M0036_16890 [Desulfobacteraceae bacterium]|nr:hypothetical protein [Desulfobacteraceae bacterium]
MAAINQEAIQELNVVLDLIKPASLEAGVEVFTTLSIRSIAPTGLGGFIELTPGNNAYIHGRRLEARYSLILRGNNALNLQTSADRIIEAFMGADQKFLRENGILKIAQSGSDFQALAGASREIRLTFDMVYEYQQLPEESEEIIEEIPVNLTLDTNGG